MCTLFGCSLVKISLDEVGDGLQMMASCTESTLCFCVRRGYFGFHKGFIRLAETRCACVGGGRVVSTDRNLRKEMSLQAMMLRKLRRGPPPKSSSRPSDLRSKFQVLAARPRRSTRRPSPDLVTFTGWRNSIVLRPGERWKATTALC